MRMSKSKLNEYHSRAAAKSCRVIRYYKYKPKQYKPRVKWYELSIILALLALSTAFLGYLITNHSAVQEGIAKTVITGV